MSRTTRTFNARNIGTGSSAIALATSAMLMSACGGGSAGAAGTAAVQPCPQNKQVSALASTASAMPIAKDVGTFLEAATDPSASGADRAAAQAQAPLAKLHGHVLAASKQSSDLGKADDSQSLNLTIALSPSNAAQLAQDVSAIYTPGSTTYRHYLTPQEFRERYAPSAEQVAQVQAYLQSQGLQDISVEDSGFLVRAKATPSVANAAFHTEIHQYTSQSGKTYRAPAYELQVPAGLPIQGVHGLQNLTVRHTHLVRRSSNASSTATAKNGTGSGYQGGFAPADLRTAYNVPTSGGGTGQTLALFELDGYNASDIQGYEQQFGIPNVPLQNVLVDGATGVASDASAEVPLDIELMTALAPNAAKILVYEGDNSDTGILDTYQKIATDNEATSISSSWGSAEDGSSSSFLQSENTIFMQMAAQGQTIFAAAGDSGAYDDGNTLSVDDPGSQPYVVAVGGTLLTTNASQAWQSETTWNGGSISSGAGGGGISSVWSIPSWQQGLATAANKGSSTMRNTPDVSLHADESTGYAIYFEGSWSDWGGTSCAAPLWAAYMSLVNEARIAQGKPNVGYVTPTLYALGKGSTYSNDFHDINDGSTNLYYPAVTGYDNATGWGSFNGTNLMNDLLNETPGSSTGAGSSPVSGGTSTASTGCTAS